MTTVLFRHHGNRDSAPFATPWRTLNTHMRYRRQENTLDQLLDRQRWIDQHITRAGHRGRASSARPSRSLSSNPAGTPNEFGPR
ncbi:MAG: hypothetical protein ABWY20_06080 [Mycobacterium sp.]